MNEYKLNQRRAKQLESSLNYNKNTNENEADDRVSNRSSMINKKKIRSGKQESSLLCLVEKNLFVIVLGVRTLSALFNLIWDCDETYNYWEPLHFLAYRNGLQTWEYSPVYALRSYAYIFIHLMPIYAFLDHVSKITAFYMVRFGLAFLMSYMETRFYFTLKKIDKHSSNVHVYYLLLSLTNVGLFTSATSFLPSSFCMYLTLYAYDKWYSCEMNKAVFGCGLATLLGWPFSALLGIPILIDYLFLYKHGGVFRFVKYVCLFALVILTPLVLIDSYMYGRLTVAPLNIVMYNVFSGSQKGPDLYGREPFSYYIKNFVLNFNLLYPLAMLAVLICTLSSSIGKKLRLSQLGLLAWLFVFMTRPHKEERFMYPIYPLLVLNSAIALSFIKEKLAKRLDLTTTASMLINSILCAHFFLSLSRFLALYFNFSASLDLFVEFNRPMNKFASTYMQNLKEINVCVGKEWYRAPGSFFMPKDFEQPDQVFRLKFVRSEFGGQLPGYFNENLSLPESTRFIDPLFNDENKQVNERLIDLKKCHFFFDTDSRLDDAEFNRLNNLSNWKTILAEKFIDQAENSNLFKSFYVPYLYEKRVKFTQFKLRARVY